MFSGDFAKCLDSFPHTKQYFKGVFARDTLPNTLKVNHFLICNTDIAVGPGQHWFCVVRTKKDELECFDSLGINTEKKLFLSQNFHLKGIRKIKFNISPVQSELSTTCGNFVLYFIINRLYNIDFGLNDLLNDIFSLNVEANELRVKKFCANHLNG